jgi:sarcosine oxidase
LQWASEAGADLHFEEAVESWRATESGVSVKTRRGEYQAERLVITPGPWAPELLRDMGVPVAVERQVLLWFQPRGGIEGFLPDRFPIYIWHESDERQPYGFPAVDGPEGGVKVAFFRKPQREVCTPESVDRRIREEDIGTLRESIRRFLPSLDGTFLRGTTCLYTVTPDLNFVLGAHPNQGNVVVGCGFSGHGYKFCSVVGEVLADLALEGRTRLDLSLFDPKRFSEL